MKEGEPGVNISSNLDFGVSLFISFIKTGAAPVKLQSVGGGDSGYTCCSAVTCISRPDLSNVQFSLNARHSVLSSPVTVSAPALISSVYNIIAHPVNMRAD